MWDATAHRGGSSKRVLLTGMSGTGKSSVLRRLAALGYRTVDTDEEDFTVEVRGPLGTEWLWREDRMQHILSTTEPGAIFIAGTCRNQVGFYPRFNHIVLLSAPAAVLVRRLRTRTNNPYGKNASELAEVLRNLDAVEPLLRAAATLEIDTRAPLDEVVQAILRHAAA